MALWVIASIYLPVGQQGFGTRWRILGVVVYPSKIGHLVVILYRSETGIIVVEFPELESGESVSTICKSRIFNSYILSHQLLLSEVSLTP